jgi:hypothetical protein
MTEIKKTLAILKARWPEVAFIIGFHILATRSNILLIKLIPESMRNLFLINRCMPLPLLLFLLICTLLRCGFLRTVYLEGAKRQSPFVLLRIGTRFLWRMFVLGMIYSIPFIILTIGFLNLPSLRDILWLFPVLVNLVLIKIIVLIPALVIVLDCRAFDSFKFLKRYKLSNAKELIFLYCGNIAIGLLVPILSRYYSGTSRGTTCCSITTIPQYTLTTVFSIVGYFISLIIAVMAVRFVASHDSAYDDYRASLNSESLQ